LSSYYFPEDLYPLLWNANTLFNGYDLLKNYHVNINTIPNASACVFRKDLARFDDDLLSMSYCGDWLFWARLMKQTDVYFLAEKLNYWRSSEQSTRSSQGSQTDQKRYRECTKCLKKIRELIESKRIKLQNYDWLFLSYYSSEPIWKFLFQNKPDIPVSSFRFKIYLFRSFTFLLFKKSFKKVLRIKKA
jgi:hypothetical protein